jgi:hypothetical protein
MPLRGPFDQPVDSLSGAVSGFVRDFLTLVITPPTCTQSISAGCGTGTGGFNRAN